MEIKVFDKLPQAAEQVRTIVFVEEQGFVNEMDETDHVATHFVMFDEEKPVAVCRVFWEDEMHSYILGRLAVLKEYRGKKLGARMIESAEEHVRSKGGKGIALHSQCVAAGFYRKQGYIEQGNVEDIEGCPHIWMYKRFCNEKS